MTSPHFRDLDTLLRAADPLAAGPGGPASSPEQAAALARTRAAVRRAAAPVAAYGTYRAPWGDIFIAVTERGLAAIDYHTTGQALSERLAARLGGAAVPEQSGLPATMKLTLQRARAELDEYFAGRRTAFDLTLDLTGVAAFDRLVLEGVRRLGFGEVTSYGRLASAIGRPRAARAVGGALGRNPIGIIIPCHRILAGDGQLGGYSGGLEVKRLLLRLEGVRLPHAFAGGRAT